MKLYADFCLIGFMGVALACIQPSSKPKVTTKDYYCDQTLAEYKKFKSLTSDERKALLRPRKEAILGVITKYERTCM